MPDGPAASTTSSTEMKLATVNARVETIADKPRLATYE